MANMDSILGKPKGNEDGEHWLTVSDLMAGLMMVFLFIAIAFMRHVSIERDKIKDVAVAYQQNQVAIFDALNEEFRNDLSQWKAMKKHCLFSLILQKCYLLLAKVR